jgi:putative PIN family toxin of toxin-antitoxin system
MPRVVFDTVVFVRSLINPAGVWGRLVFDHAGDYRLIVSEPIAREVLEVIRRPELARKYRGLATRNLHAILAILAGAEAVDLTASAAQRADVPISRDPKDDKFLLTAALAGADYLVTEDRDILDDFATYQGVAIVNALTFLRLLEAPSDEHAKRD